MTCADARELLLEAEPHDLRPRGRGPLSEHLGACPRCRALADAILRGEAALGGGLAALAAAGAARVAIAAGTPPPRAEPTRPSRVARVPARSRARRRVALAVLPLAAAATLVLLPSAGAGPAPLPDPDVVLHPPVPFVEAPAGGPVAVLESGPGITVVWFF